MKWVHVSKRAEASFLNYDRRAAALSRCLALAGALLLLACLRPLPRPSSSAARRRVLTEGGPGGRAVRAANPPSSQPAGLAAPASDSLAHRLLGCAQGNASFECLRAQHTATTAADPGPGGRDSASDSGNSGAAASQPAASFNFPHFFVIGWQKCATTSLHRYLERHPQVLPPRKKEPYFFTSPCAQGDPGCPPEKWARRQEEYLAGTLRMGRALGGGLQQAAYEATAGYGKAGAAVAAVVRRELPWVRVVASLREPIGQAVSLLNHHLWWLEEKGMTTPTLAPGRPCLKDSDLFTCLKRYFTEESDNRAYAPALADWVAAFPREQLLVVQYEDLSSPHTQPAVLGRLKDFLGLNPALPAAAEGAGDSLDRSNARQKRGSGGRSGAGAGWQLDRRQYQELVDLVRPDAQQVAELLARNGLGGGAAWLQKWEAIWGRNLAACPEEGPCNFGDA